MAHTVEPGTVLNFATETFEFLSTPRETGDRYRVRLTATPNGGPGVRGFGPHIHDGSTEIFTCISGVMTYRLERTIAVLAPGESVTVPPGSVHGFKNTGEKPLVIEVDVVFGPDGPQPETDPVPLAVTVAKLLEAGRVSRLTGYPPILQLAVVEDAYPKATREAGIPGLLMPRLAWLGRRLGYRSDPFKTG